jgi:hypothetical protein
MGRAGRIKPVIKVAAVAAAIVVENFSSERCAKPAGGYAPSFLLLQSWEEAEQKLGNGEKKKYGHCNGSATVVFFCHFRRCARDPLPG